MRWCAGLLRAPAILLLALLLIVAACDEGGQPPSPEGTPQTTTGEETPVVTAQLPAEFPEDFPLYEGAQLRQSVRLGNQFLLLFEADDPRPEVAAFFQDALGQPPWQVIRVDEFEAQNTTSIQFADPDRTITGTVSIVSVTLDDKSTSIIVRLPLPGQETPTPAEETPTPEQETPAGQG